MFDGSEQNGTYGVIAVLRCIGGSVYKTGPHYAAPGMGWPFAAVSALNDLQIALMAKGDAMLKMEKEIAEQEKEGKGKGKKKVEEWRKMFY